MPAFASVNYLGTMPLGLKGRGYDTWQDVKALYIPERISINVPLDPLSQRDPATELDITEALLMMTATARAASPFTIFHATPSSQLATLRIWYSAGLKTLQQTYRCLMA